MKLRRPRANLAKKVSLAAVASLALAGCGEIKNTITPRPGTANQVSVALSGQPSAFDIGLYEAAARGYFDQADLKVHVVVPGPGQDPVTLVHNGQVLLGISSEPNVLLHRNESQPVVGVAALVHGPLAAITIPVPKAGPSGGVGVTTTTVTTHVRRHGTRKTVTRTITHTTAATTTTATSATTTPTTTTVSEPDATLWPAQLQQLLSKPGAPTYDGLVVVARKGSIVSHAPLIRRFIQAVARGYRAARANPTQATTDLINAVPSLAPQQPLELATLQAAMASFFPTGGKVWGWQRQAQWNAFGTWLAQNHLLSNPNATTDASTNELLQGQGV
jgi:putative hydroxymethylpyrimidine transport system substrate-binding protein